MESALRFAQAVIASGLAPNVRTVEKAFVILATGAELGLTAMQSLRSIHIIDGKPSLSADLIVGLVKRSPVCEWFQMVESTNTRAVYETKRSGEPAPARYEFATEDAHNAGLLSKANWRKFPAAMLRARCSSALARAVYPDIVAGLYDPDEAGEFSSANASSLAAVEAASPPFRAPEVIEHSRTPAAIIDALDMDVDDDEDEDELRSGGNVATESGEIRDAIAQPLARWPSIDYGHIPESILRRPIPRGMSDNLAGGNGPRSGWSTKKERGEALRRSTNWAKTRLDMIKLLNDSDGKGWRRGWLFPAEAQAIGAWLIGICEAEIAPVEGEDETQRPPLEEPSEELRVLAGETLRDISTDVRAQYRWLLQQVARVRTNGEARALVSEASVVAGIVPGTTAHAEQVAHAYGTLVASGVLAPIDGVSK
jgi:hypothetical protein